MMKEIIYLEWGYEYDADIQNAMKQKGLVLHPIRMEHRADEKLYPPLSQTQTEQLARCLEETHADTVFSINFLASVSDWCMEQHVKYAAWVLQLPNIDLLTAAVEHDCNRIGICDSYLTERLLQRRVGHICYLPDAVAGCHRVRNNMVRACSYVAQAPFAYEDTPFGEHGREMTEITMGYLTGMIHCQRVLYGATMLETVLIGSAANELMEKYPLPENILPEFHKLYLSEVYIAPEITRLQQLISMNNLAARTFMEAFTDAAYPDCIAKRLPYPAQLAQREQVYGTSIINYVQTPNSYHDAIPHRTLEIMASGNFALVNFQKDYSCFFKQNENIVCFGDELEKIQLYIEYGKDAEKREHIVEAALETISAGHTYAHRIDYMLANWGE